MSSDAFKPKTMKRKNVKGLALGAPSMRNPDPSAADAQVPGSLANNNNAPSKAITKPFEFLEMGVEFQLDMRDEDLEVIKELGAGNGGTVSKVLHKATRGIMARKIIRVEAKQEVRKRIVRELQIMRECQNPNIVTFYGAFLSSQGGDVNVCMEYMDVGSLDSISKSFGPVRVDVLGKIAEAVLGGLAYLYRAHRIMHRDIKPSNILVNSKGQIKLCDFGVSSELENSIADTFVGTGTYMAPERIQGSPYTVKSDIWSVGLTLMELAIGKFPFHSDAGAGAGSDDEPSGPQGILDLLQQIVMEPSPKLPKSDAFPTILEDFISKCLMKKPEDRPTPQELYDSDAFLQAAKRTPVDLEAWAVSMMERHNRKSHLLLSGISPANKALLRSASSSSSSKGASSSSASSKAHPPIPEDQPTPPASTSVRSALNSASSSSRTTSTAPTPTSGDIPVMSNVPNGAPSSASRAARPAYPTRTSSASQVPINTSSASSSSGAPYNAHLPIRPAPPPASSKPGGEQEFANGRRPLPRMGNSDPRLVSGGSSRGQGAGEAYYDRF